MLYRYSYLSVIFVVALVISLISVNSLFAHCQIPCGIYGDKMRFDMIEEHITTVEKSMKQIKQLSEKSSVNYNQLVRWIDNKDEHAQKIQDIVDAYFLTQRIKPVDASDQMAYKEYQHKVTLLHQMLVYAMKTKQTTDLANVEKLRELVKKFYKAYFNQEMEKHMEEHHE